jgi:SAM-dependent methyltransferase
LNKDELIKTLDILSRKTNQEWMAGLEGRKRKELEFHDRHRDQECINKLPQDSYERLYGFRKYYRTVHLSTDYLNRWIDRHAAGRIFLDYACGNGKSTIRAARAGADLSIGMDISEISVKNARQFAIEKSVADNTYFLQGDCENSGLPNACVDLILCAGVLHHLDLSYVFPELRRILKPGGIILAVEALDYNPLIKLYRNWTPQMRTDWEKSHILSYKDLRFARRFFDVKNVRHWHLFSIAGAYLASASFFLNGIDKVILKWPLVNKLSWMFTFELHKKESGSRSS